MKARTRLILWGYCVVPIATALVCAVFIAVFPIATLDAVLEAAIPGLRPVGYAFLTLTAALFIWYLGLVKSSFGEWLAYRDADSVYVVAFAWPVLGAITYTVAASIAEGLKTQPWRLVTGALLVLMVITLAANMVNAWKLLKLRHGFQAALRGEDKSAGEQPFKSQE